MSVLQVAVLAVVVVAVLVVAALVVAGMIGTPDDDELDGMGRWEREP